MVRRRKPCSPARPAMRNLPARPPLSPVLASRLTRETKAISEAGDPKVEAEKRYRNARKATWFAPVVRTLGKLAGPGERCMFCSGSESSDVEHYRPKAVFPELAMTWENYLWSCTPCNRGKSNRFPPDTEPGERLINPMEEDVWTFFFIDEFGMLTPRFDPAVDALNRRGVTTRDLLSLNREAVRESRQMRLNDLRQKVQDALKLMRRNELTKAAARQRLETWKQQPWQPDVADFFLQGPGGDKPPFSTFLAAL